MVWAERPDRKVCGPALDTTPLPGPRPPLCPVFVLLPRPGTGQARAQKEPRLSLPCSLAIGHVMWVKDALMARRPSSLKDTQSGVSSTMLRDAMRDKATP